MSSSDMSAAVVDAFALDETQSAVRELFGALFANEATLSHARDAEPLGFDADLWSRLRAIDAPGLGVSSGLGLRELAIMAEEIGRCVASVPLVEHTVASRLVERCTGTVPDDITDGSAIATVALRSATDRVWRVTPAGAVATVVIGVDGDDLVLTRSEPGMTALRNHACAPLAHRSSAETAERRVIGSAHDIDHALTEWRLLTAASLVAMSQTALDLGVQYARERRQFGVPIGSFQAIQHLLADLPGMIDGARLLVHEAAWILDTADGATGNIDLADERIDDGPTLASMAFVFAADVAATATHRSLHVHGGYGFSDEYDIQLLHRRARGWPLVAGDLGGQYQRLADRLLSETPA